MNIIPYIENPTVNEVLKHIEKIPCSVKAEKIILNEVSKGNTIISVGDAGCMPDETVVVIKFREDAKNEYSEAKAVKLHNGSYYKLLCFSDNHGAVEFRFGTREGFSEKEIYYMEEAKKNPNCVPDKEKV